MQTVSTVRTTPQATPVAMTTTEEVEEADTANMEPADSEAEDLEPVTALESVTPEKEMIKRYRVAHLSVHYSRDALKGGP